MPKGFEQNGHVLNLTETLCGLRQSPRAFWQYLTEKLEANGMKQSEIDHYLFIGEKVICIVYVDDLLFCARDDIDLNRSLGVDLEDEHDAAGVLGVSLALCSANSPLTRDDEGEPTLGDFNNAPVVGMLLYLAGRRSVSLTMGAAFGLAICHVYLPYPLIGRLQAVWMHMIHGRGTTSGL